MWITTGPGGRAYVGPLFVPDAGPCAACLLVHFKRLSPAPELYDALIAHDGAIAATPFPDAALEMVAALARWKLSLAANPMAAALYALHVIEVGDLIVTAHAPLIDVECTQCR
jgi:bacteriocin biosynthesis cyclodehydratase domain-containing protein